MEPFHAQYINHIFTTMKKYLLLTSLLFTIILANAQIRILQVDPDANTMKIKNFGAMAVNVSSYRVCQFPIYPAFMSLGSPMMVMAGMEVTLDLSSSAINLNDAGGNVAIYFNGSDFGDQNNMADFVQWGVSFGGRETVADAKGIWILGNFLMGPGPYMYTGDATEMGNRMPFWMNSMGGMMELMYKPHSDQLLFAGRMNGDQAGITTDAVGIGSFMLNSTMDTICYEISVNGLSGIITAIHLHNAPVGMMGPVVIDLGAGIDGNIVKGSITGTELSDHLMNFLKGELYINLHTMANAGGEIRGQVYLEKDMLFEAKADTMQQNHTVNAPMNPVGLGSFTLGQNKKMINYMFVGTDLTGMITAAHLHYGAMGSDGGVAVDLSSGIMMGMPVIKGSFDASMVTGFVDSLMAGKVYLNVHTMMNAAGEVRGQLMMNNGIAFDAMLDTMQQNMPVMGMNNGMGVGHFKLNYSMDTLWYDILVDGMTGPITAIHMHDGIVGMNGGVMIDMSAGISGNRVQGMVLTAELPQPRIAKFLRGGAYVNVHTAMNPAGELRGQMFKLARDGYVMTISGDQQTPPITVDGIGAGLASVDRNWTNAHYMMVVSDLTAPLTAAHFHTAEMGVMGPVVYNLSSVFSGTGTDDAAFGFWTNMDMNMPFMMSDGQTFWNDSIYLNIHTAANPSGELRGQATMDTECSDVNTGLNDNTAFAEDIIVYPNPTAGQFSIRVPFALGSERSLQIHNSLGQVVMGQTLNGRTGNDQFDVDMAGMPEGAYFIRVNTQQGVFTNTLILAK